MTGEVGEESLPLSVVVVARDEEDRIRECIESVFSACSGIETFEVLFVDSNSSDRTLERAGEYPVTVLRIPEDRLTTPGAGRYVGTAHADGDAILFVDGDMALTDEWLPAAMARLREPGVAAVDGHLNDVSEDASTRDVDSVRGVALYDAAALRSVGGFDPQLAAVEDIHLGYELDAAGHRLLRLPTIVARHPSREPLREPLRRWRRGYARGNGQAIRKSVRSPRLLAKHVYRVRHRLVVGAWCCLGVASLATGAGVLAWLLATALGFTVVTEKRGGPTEAVVYLLHKVSLIFGLALGLLDEPKPDGWFPLDRVEVVADGPVHRGTVAPLED